MADEPVKPDTPDDNDVGKPDLSTHPLVAKLNPEGEIPHGRVPLIGFIGPSRKDGHVRVYRDLTFRSYYEVPADAVEHTIPVNRDDPDSPTKVLVPYDTPIDIVEVTTHHVEAGFVAGNIAQGRLGYVATGGALPGPICTTAFSCPTAPCHTQDQAVAGPAGPCTTLYTCPSACPRQCTGITTVVTCNVTCPDICLQGGGGAQICTTAITCPSGCPRQCTGVTTAVTCNVTCPDICQQQAQAQAIAPTPPCTTAITCPTGCPQQCTGVTTYVTCNATCPEICRPCTGITTYATCNATCPDICQQQAQAQAQVAGPICTTAITCPTGCPRRDNCTGITTAITCNVTCPDICHQAAAGGGAQAAAMAAPAAGVGVGAQQQLCITLYTAYPTWCPPCTGPTTYVTCPGSPAALGGGGAEMGARGTVCTTVYTNFATDCRPTCRPYNTAIPTTCGT